MSARILIVDDDESILRSLRRVLEHNGYTVDTAQTAADAIDKLKGCRYDLVIVDFVLPDMRGTELLSKTKKELQQTIKFIITGYPSAEAGAKARDERADAFILKPIKMPDLLAMIHVFLNEEEPSYVGRNGEKNLPLSGVSSDLPSQAKE